MRPSVEDLLFLSGLEFGTEDGMLGGLSSELVAVYDEILLSEADSILAALLDPAELVTIMAIVLDVVVAEGVNNGVGDAVTAGAIDVIWLIISPRGKEKKLVPALEQQSNDLFPSQQYWPFEH
jgi:hypothetical protein